MTLYSLIMTLTFQYPDIFTPVLDNLYNPQYRYFDIFGGRASGKSHDIAQIMIELALTENCRILCCREVQKSIKESSKKLLESKIIEHNLEQYFTITEYSITCVTGSVFLFMGLYRNEQGIRSTDGIKYVWVEEAQSLSLESMKSLAPTIREAGAKLFFTYNPLEEPDPIVEYLALRKDRTLHLEMNYYHNPWCPTDIQEEADQLKIDDYDDWLHVYGGKPMTQGENAIISRVELQKAVEREIKPEGRKEVGVDVARFGDDRTQFYMRKGLKVISSDTFKKQDTVTTCNYLEEFVDYDKTIPIKVDDTGIGGAVTDQMKVRGYYVVPVNNGEKAMEPDRYPNAISEMWFNVRNLLNEMDIPNDKELHQELTRRRYKYDSKGRRCVESKDDYKKRYGNSPDKADAFLLAYYEKNLDYLQALNVI